MIQLHIISEVLKQQSDDTCSFFEMHCFKCLYPEGLNSSMHHLPIVNYSIIEIVKKKKRSIEYLLFVSSFQLIEKTQV